MYDSIAYNIWMLWADRHTTYIVLTECPILPSSIEHGFVNGSGSLEGALHRFNCESGYSLIGVDLLACTDSGVWNGSLPICLISKEREEILQLVTSRWSATPNEWTLRRWIYPKIWIGCSGRNLKPLFQTRPFSGTIFGLPKYLRSFSFRCWWFNCTTQKMSTTTIR